MLPERFFHQRAKLSIARQDSRARREVSGRYKNEKREGEIEDLRPSLDG
jgi:hypothetical protein